VLNHTQQKIRGKLTDRGRACLFLGYSETHAADVYRMLNLDTHRVIHSRDIIWMNKTYGQYKNITDINRVSIESDDESDDDDSYHYVTGRDIESGRDDEIIIVDAEADADDASEKDDQDDQNDQMKCFQSQSTHAWQER
jgi:hypothetical protein